ncbi:hypothetical protein PoB_004181600 [Plakobranchus ocellatus]|uniref:Uncharacterized protein n=1 Tax=Plakobranchus ocellatus TaxID=259542 RepID=A0AAV4AW44_9GAST|nr:hypothetical protein PoB_004181600 [Plakobranchus ocellatus]
MWGLRFGCDVLDLIVTYVVTGTTWILVSSLDMTSSLHDDHETEIPDRRENKVYVPISLLVVFVPGLRSIPNMS